MVAQSQDVDLLRAFIKRLNTMNDRCKITYGPGILLTYEEEMMLMDTFGSEYDLLVQEIVNNEN
jgi:hypothetical protein